ncbi:MAG: SOS response-associated peptidase [Planctomycetes bacterium]|nr:SOS response-associated peptidase [Planctomycetota bacterium]
MCGRYVLKSRMAQLMSAFGLVEEFRVFGPSYNIAPMQFAPVIVIGDAGRRVMRPMRWGLVPRWAKDETIGNKLINARAETIGQKPAFRDAYRHRRCVVPADGFYEWKKTGDHKQPYYIHRRDGEAFAFAGLWESWRDAADQPVETYTIITTEPNALLAPIHNRMPVILTASEIDDWLKADADRAGEVLRPSDAEALCAEPVSPRVNTPSHDGPDLIDPIDDMPQTLF